MKTKVQVILRNLSQNLLHLVFIFTLFTSTISAQNLIKNGNFDAGMSDWNTTLSTCPAANSPAWAYYTTDMVASYPILWNATAFLQNKLGTSISDPMILSQTVAGLIPAAGNSINIKLDVIIAEALIKNAANAPAEYLNDQITLELWLGGTKYATITTPSGWYSEIGDEFGRCNVVYFNGATSVNYSDFNSIKSIASSFTSGDFPTFSPEINSNWDISIPWECGKTASALFEIKVQSNTYLGKSITDVLGQTYTQTCTLNTSNNLDEIAVDNIVIENKLIIDTPQLLVSNLTSSVCGQSIFNLVPCVEAIPECPMAEPNSLEYLFFEDANLTIPIQNPTNFVVNDNEDHVYVVLASKVSEASFRKISSIVRDLKITKNSIITAGSIGNTYELCSNTLATEITDVLSPEITNGADISYFWEKSVGNINGPFTAASGVNTGLNYLPVNLTTSNEIVTNYYFRRKVLSTLNGLTCEQATLPVNVTVKPCAPMADNKSVEFVSNPGGLNTLVIPNNLFSATPVLGTINSLILTRFPVKSTSLKITSTVAGARIATSTTYCGTPAAAGCVGVPFPINGVSLPTNIAGNLVNNTLELDPLDGSILVVVPYKSVDSRGFTSTEAESSILIGTPQALPVNLSYFNISKENSQSVELNWKTAQEKNFSHFEIEAAFNGLIFSKKAKVLPVENGNYSQIIDGLNEGIWYFRLKMVDTDGSFAFSAIKSIVISDDIDSKVVLLKNPTSDNIKLQLKLEQGFYQSILMDQLGRTISHQTFTSNGLESELTLIQKPKTTGIYFLKLINEDKQIIAIKKVAFE